MNTGVACYITRASILAVQLKFDADYCKVPTSCCEMKKSGQGSLSRAAINNETSCGISDIQNHAIE